MTRMIRGSVLLAACVGVWSCSSDPTADEAGVPYKVVALPSVVFIKQDSSQLIEFQLVDQLDGQIPEQWTLTSTSPNFTVALDSTYRVVYNSDGTLTLPDSQTQVRATITGTALGISNFTASAGGKSLVIPVNVVPGTLYATFSPANPNPGDVVTMTMPPTLRLTPASVITFPGNVNPVSVVIAADSMSATFINAPTTDTTASVTNVYNTEFPTIPPVPLSTQTKLTSAVANTFTGKLPATLSPLVAGQLTVTLNAAYAFKCNPTCGNALPSVFSFPAQTAPTVASVSADSTVAVLNVGPNVASPLQVTRVTFKGAPQFEYTLVSADSVYSSVISSVPITITPTNPQVGDTVTLTAGPGFTFAAAATVSWPLGSTAIVANTAGNVIKVLPMPGSAGLPSAITNVIPASAPAFQLTLPASLASGGPLAMQATSIYGGRGTPGTATQLTIPPIGTDTLEFYDLSQNIDQFYGLTFASNATLAIRISWPGGADIDILTCSGIACSAFYGGFAGATGANPENTTVAFTAAAPGPNFYIWANLYAGTAPAWMRVRVIRTL
jgi:hypothetical protein